MTIEYKDSKRIIGLSTDTKPTNVETNSILVEKNNSKRYWFDGTNWITQHRAVLMGGNLTNVIQYFTIDTLGNTTDFGDITQSVYDTAGCASDTRAIRGGGLAVWL